MPQLLEEGKSFYQGRSHHPRVGCGEKSADAIVVAGNEPRTETAEASQGNEGLNIKMFQIKQGCHASLAISGTGQIKKTNKPE